MPHGTFNIKVDNDTHADLQDVTFPYGGVKTCEHCGEQVRQGHYLNGTTFVCSIECLMFHQNRKEVR